jgi:hypothetical protein
MDRLSDWRPAAWIALCLAAIAAAGGLLIPAALRHDGRKTVGPVVRATLTPRTHLFGQSVTATLELPSRFVVKTSFAPYRVVRRTVSRHGPNTRYEFTLDCLRSRCVGLPGAEREVILPPIRVTLPNARTVTGYWPTLREASRLAPTDLGAPQLRGELAAPERKLGGGRNLLTGLLLAVGAALALAAAAVLGLHWLAWRPPPVWVGNGRRDPSTLDYALLVTGLAAGGGARDRRTALESLAVALEERGLGHLAAEARSLAWSPRPPAGESVRRLAEDAQKAVKETA